MSIEKVLINVSYSDNSNKFWSESTLRNKVVEIDTSINVHDQISKLCSDADYMEFSYNNRPVSNVYKDCPDSSKIIGYVYRCKTEINNKRALFDVWVTMYKVTDMDFDVID